MYLQKWYFTFPILVSQILGYFPLQTFIGAQNTQIQRFPKISATIWISLSVVCGIGFIIQRIFPATFGFETPDCFAQFTENSFHYKSLLGWGVFQTITSTWIRIDSLRNSKNIENLWNELNHLFSSQDLSEKSLLHLKRWWNIRSLWNIILSTILLSSMAYINFKDVLGVNGCAMGRFFTLVVSGLTLAQNFSLQTVELYLQLLSISVDCRTREIRERELTEPKNEQLSLVTPKKMLGDFHFIVKVHKILDSFNSTYDSRLTLDTLNFIGIGSLLSYFIIVIYNAIMLEGGPVVCTLILLLILVHNFYKFCDVCSHLPKSYENLVCTSIESFECRDYAVPTKLLHFLSRAKKVETRFCDINCKLLSSITAAITTYIIVLVQFNSLS